MKIIPLLSLRETKYVHLTPRQCQGCWECVEVCPADVLAKMERGFHPHVHIKNPEACTGCKKCVLACEYAAIEYTYVPPSARSPRQAMPE
ncbi:MAG: ferredoxin family protein [Anaerolineales bacterium]